MKCANTSLTRNMSETKNLKINEGKSYKVRVDVLFAVFPIAPLNEMEKLLKEIEAQIRSLVSAQRETIELFCRCNRE